MKRIIFMSMAVMLTLTACDAISDDGIIGEYQGVTLPELENGGEEMNALLDLAESQNGPIDDALFVQALKESVFVCTDRYMLYEKDQKREWRWAFNYVGGRVTGAVMMEDDKVYTIHDDNTNANPAGLEFASYMRTLGYDGWYNTNEWSYDANTNTLITKYDGQMLAAKVLYFGMGKVVVEGHVLGVATLIGNTPRFSNELCLFEFKPVREEFLKGKASAEEYYNLWDAHCKENGVENKFSLRTFTNIN